MMNLEKFFWGEFIIFARLNFLMLKFIVVENLGYDFKWFKVPFETNKIQALTRHIGKEELNLFGWIGKGVYGEFFGGEFIIFARLNFVTLKFSNVENLGCGLKWFKVPFETNKMWTLICHVGKEELNLLNELEKGRGFMVNLENGKIFLGIYHFCAIKFRNVEI